MKISIITPSFNQAQFIEATIRSVISQVGDFKIEYIIMDGGSTDGSIEILKRYEEHLQNDSRIEFTWISEKDAGQSDAINKGLKRVTGDIIAYINSDDLYAPYAFKCVVNFFQTHPNIGFVYGKCNIIDEEQREIRKFIKYYRTLLGRRYSYAKLLSENFIPQPATFWKYAVYKSCGEFDISHHLCLDYEYWCRIGQKYRGAFLNSYLASFRWYRNSKSGANFRKQFLDELSVAKQYAAGRYRLSILIHHFNYWKTIIIYNLMRFFKI